MISRRDCTRLASIIVAVVFSMAAVCSGAEPPAISTPPASLHVIQISVDGLGSLYLKAYLQEQPDQFPNFRRFVQEGATTLNARTDYFRTITLPNHTSMLTGRPVFAPEGQPKSVAHNYSSNTDPKIGQTLHTCNPAVAYMASTFDVAHDAGLATGFYASKTKFSLYTTSYDITHGAANRHGRNKVDYQGIRQTSRGLFNPLISAAGMQQQFLADLKQFHPAYCFVHYAEPDSAGHAKKWGSKHYEAAVQEVDAHLGQLFKAIDADPVLHNHTIIILTSDHGGLPGGSTHDKADDPSCYTIPFFVWGAGVARGDLYTINASTRSDPVARRPDYNAPKQPIRNGDAGNLALKLLGLRAIPGSTINATQNLAVRP